MHVEAVLMKSDFDPDVFTNDPEKTPRKEGGSWPTQRSPSALSDLSTDGIAVLKKDSNWDFADVDRPPIYMVDVHEHSATDISRK